MRKDCSSSSVNPFEKCIKNDNFLEYEPEAGDENHEIDEDNDALYRPSISDAMRHPEMRICKPLGLLRREYKHPLSMYEDAISSMYSR